MALRAGLVALSTKLKTGSQRLWFTGVNGDGSCEREKNVRSKATSKQQDPRAKIQEPREWIPWFNQGMTIWH